VCEAGENGANCGQDCCDWYTACAQTRQNDGVHFCRDLRVNGVWQGYRWVTVAETSAVCNDPADHDNSLAICGQGTEHVCCNNTWISGTVTCN
jgi:hypothetical protein